MADQLISETQGLININTRKEMALMSGLGYGAAALYQAMAPEIDYSVFQMTGEHKKIQASNVELEATQQANAIRAQFNENAGNYIYTASRRGVKVREGSAAQNIEKSAKALGTDVSKIKRTAKYKGDLLKMRGEHEQELGKLKGKQQTAMRPFKYAGLASNIYSSYRGFKKHSKFK